MRTSALLALCALALAACDPAVRTSPPARVPAPARGPHHTDPSPPFALTLEARALDAADAEVSVRAVPTRDLPALTLGVTLTQELTALSSPAVRDFGAVHAGVPVVLSVRVRRTTPGPYGVTLHAYAETRDVGVLLGDEREAVLFGSPAPTQWPRTRVVTTPDGTRLHDTVIE